jgi:uncharacterized protein YciI
VDNNLRAGEPPIRDMREIQFGMEFDHYSIVFLKLRKDAPQLTEEESAVLQDAHMAHLADLHDAGHLLVAGPLLDDEFRGMSILKVAPTLAKKLKESDPAVLAGRFEVMVIPWMVPGGIMSFSETALPRSMAEVE